VESAPHRSADLGDGADNWWRWANAIVLAQRHNQVIEETPAPALRHGTQRLDRCRAPVGGRELSIGGTVEFIYDNDAWYF
jgi:acetyl/propionyl-CoA carboxylase alpha subunit